AGGVATGWAWVNLSGGAAAGGPGGSAPVWTFGGVGDPNEAALVLMGVVALSGLVLLYRRRSREQRSRSPSAAPSSSRRPPTSAPARPAPGRPNAPGGPKG
ncbi:MAG TPA: hypothetical protein VGS23_02645, partial [Thermoplasmata archaeon]|nr:hypothetical protein [Thermoplasmata archaeon]